MNDYLMHYGVLGQKWGVRRYQNEDGSYKSGAKGRYSELIADSNRAYEKKVAQNAKTRRSTVRAARKQMKRGEMSKNDFKNAKEQAKITQDKENTKAFNTAAREQNKILRNTSGKQIAVDTALRVGGGVVTALAGKYVSDFGESEGKYGMMMVGKMMEGYGVGTAIGGIMVGGLNYGLKKNLK